MKKLLMVAFVAAALCYTVPAKADAVYTYTGGALNTPSGCTGCYVSLTFDLQSALGPSLTDDTLTSPDLVSFNISDNNGDTFNQSDSSIESFEVSTGSSGAITAWDIGACGDFVGPFSTCISTENDSNAVSDQSVTFFCIYYPICGPIGGYSGVPGAAPALEDPTAAPENSTWLLLASGLLALGFLYRRRTNAMRFVPATNL